MPDLPGIPAMIFDLACRILYRAAAIALTIRHHYHNRRTQ